MFKTDSVILAILSDFESPVDLVILSPMSSYTSLLKMMNWARPVTDRILHKRYRLKRHRNNNLFFLGVALTSVGKCGTQKRKL
jgi:hypothetical protein